MSETKPHKCKDWTPPTFSGRWQDWHKGHGCDIEELAVRMREAALREHLIPEDVKAMRRRAIDEHDYTGYEAEIMRLRAALSKATS